MSSIKPEIDVELDRIVLECLQKEPDERYNSVKDIAVIHESSKITVRRHLGLARSRLRTVLEGGNVKKNDRPR